MSEQSHDVIAHQRDSCLEETEARGPDAILLCWLASGHDGEHWDMVDKVHWSKDPELAVTPCTHEAVAT